MGGTLVLLVKLAFSMAVVMIVMGVAARVVRRRQGLSGDQFPNGGKPGGSRSPWPRRGKEPIKPPPAVDVLSRRSLAKGANLVLVRAGGKQYLLGVTEQSVNLLFEVGDDQASPAALPTSSRRRLDAPGEVTRPSSSIADLRFLEPGRTPAPLGPATPPGQPATAWKLAIDSLRERTVRH